MQDAPLVREMWTYHVTNQKKKNHAPSELQLVLLLQILFRSVKKKVPRSNCWDGSDQQEKGHNANVALVGREADDHIKHLSHPGSHIWNETTPVLDISN